MPLIYLSPYYSANDYSLPVQGIAAFRYYDNSGGQAVNYAGIVYFTTPMDYVQASGLLNEVWSGSIDGDSPRATFSEFFGFVQSTATGSYNLLFGAGSATETADHLYAALQPYTITYQAVDPFDFTLYSFADNVTYHFPESYTQASTTGQSYTFDFHVVPYGATITYYPVSPESVWFAPVGVTTPGYGFNLEQAEFPVPSADTITRYVSDTMDFAGTQFARGEAQDLYLLDVAPPVGNTTLHDTRDQTAWLEPIVITSETTGPTAQYFTTV